jgi:hypothetical protein
MNDRMLVVADETGRIFVRYNQRNLATPVNTGNLVRIQNGDAVIWGGILQIRMGPKGRISLV